MIHNEETKHKLSEMRKGKNNPFYGHKHSEETRLKLSANLKIYRNNRKYEITPPTITIPDSKRLAYIAGIIDGEGSIGYHKKAPFIAIYNNDINLMNWLTTNIGGTYRATDIRGREIGYAWSVQSVRNVYELLKSLVSFLVIKTNRANSIMKELEERYGSRLEN